MAHFALLDENNFVIKVLVINNDSMIDEYGIEQEHLGVAECIKILGLGKWVQTSYSLKFRKNFAKPGFKYDEFKDAFYDPEPPHKGWFLDENLDWVPPFPRPYDTHLFFWDDESMTWLLEDNFEYHPDLDDIWGVIGHRLFDFTYDHVNSKWIISCKIHESRPFRTFHIWNAKEVNNGTLYQDACSSTEYSIQSMEEITHGTDSINNFVIERTDENGNVSYPKISKHVVALDFAPVALITYQEFAEEDVDLFAEAWKIHPQASARDIDELFRLIIEWAWSYTELNNSEPMAVLCHDILRAVQMPIDVRNDLIALRPQPVGRFLSGDTDALIEYQDSEQMPESFRLWISDLYEKFSTRMTGSPLHVDYDLLPESYDS